MNGVLLINKHAGVSSFRIVELLKQSWVRDRARAANGSEVPGKYPKLGHGGTLDPFATGLLVVGVGKALKLSRFFLKANKVYDGVIRFGETTPPGDPTANVSERSDVLPESLESVRQTAFDLTRQPYLQIPPMFSAKKKNGKPLYLLARAGIEVDREPKICQLIKFNISEYSRPEARFQLECTSGTYVRTLAQDFGRLLGTVGMLTSLRRTYSGRFCLEKALSVEEVCEVMKDGKTSWPELPCWIPFDQLLSHIEGLDLNHADWTDLKLGNPRFLTGLNFTGEIHTNVANEIPLYFEKHLVGVAKAQESKSNRGWIWKIENAF